MDDTAPRRWFPVTVVLVAVTILAFVAQRATGLDTLEALIRLGGLQVDRVAVHREYFRLLMPVFLHQGLLHLSLNVVALVQLGWLVEEFFGSRRLLVTYVWSGVAGLLASAWLAGAPYVVSVGASGPVLGLAGLLMGTMWFGVDPLRSELVELLGRRLLWSVLLTFAFGVGLWFVVDVVDNWAHVGGFLCGVAFSFVWSEVPPEVDEDGEVVEDAPPDEPVWRTAAAVVSAALVGGAIAWTAVSGDAALATLDLDTARIYAARVSRQPGAWTNATLLPEMLSRYHAAGADAEGLDVLGRAVRAFVDPYPLQVLAGDLDEAARAGAEQDRAVLLVAERLLALAPTEPVALNLLAWDLVTVRDPALRDARRAEELARRALAAIPDPESEAGRTMTAQVLDTRAEALYQLRRYDEALAEQERATELARALEIEQIAEFETRLTKIRRSAGRG